MANVTAIEPDHFEGEDVIITIEEEGADTVLNMEGTILKVAVSGGEESVTTVTAFGNKGFAYGEPKSKVSVSMDVSVKNSDWDRIAWGQVGTDTFTALGTLNEQSSAAVSKRKRITFWFAPRANHLRTGDIVVPDKSGPMMRKIYCDCRSVNFDWEFDAAEYKKGTLTFELSPLDEEGYANIYSQFTTAYSTTPLVSLTTGAQSSTTLVPHKGALWWSDTSTRSWSGSYRT